MQKFENRRYNSFNFGFIHLIVLPVVAVLIFAGYFIWKGWNQNTQIPLPEVKNPFVSQPTPTPFPFQEITIPSLRGREYKSTLSDLEKLSEPQSYTSYLTSFTSDGFKVYGLLTIPKSTSGEAKFPAIVFVHGYIPPREYQTKLNYASYVDYLARNGFVVFKIDLRGHGNSEGEAGGAYYSDDYVVDTLSAYSALKSLEFVNPNAIGLWGHSMAGNVVFRSFVVGKNIPATVIWAGAGYTYTDLQDYMIQDTSYKPPPPDSERARERQKLREAYGNFSPDNWFWKQVPATNYLDGVTGAIQVNHAVNDNVVSIDYSRNLDSLLKQTNITHELNEYQSGGHNLSGSVFNEAMQNTVDFFKKNLSSN